MLHYSQGANLTLLNTLYISPRLDDKGKYTKPVLTLIYKDNDTGTKHMKEIVNPDYEYYILKEDLNIDYNPLFLDKKYLDKVIVPFSNLEKDIAERTGNLEFFYDNINNHNRRQNKLLHTHTRILGSDTNIEDHYRYRFSKLYKNEIIPITKSYLDIEIDNRGHYNQEIEYGKYPINAVTLCLESFNKTFTFLLRNEDNPVQQEFERTLSARTFLELKEFIKNQVGGEDGELKFGLKDMDYQFLFYDDEVSLLTDLFNCINKFKPDFTMAWNMAFDIPYIIERIKRLGIDPTDIMCPKEFKYKNAYYYIDERNKNVFAERGDFASITSYTVFLDQMIHFASRRKGQKVIASYKLDSIGEMTVGIKKLDYRHITQDLSQLPYIDYKTFVFYNIMDTIVQKCIEVKTGDIDYIFAKCLINNTRYHKGHRQTVYLSNRARKEFENKDDFILGNNINVFGHEEEFKIPGAFVGDPQKVSDYAKKRIYNNPVNLYDNCDDFDYKSLYPSIDREFNMAPNTIIGYLEMDPCINPTESTFKENANESVGGRFLEDFHSHNWLEFCTRWFNLASFKELLDDIKEFFTLYKNPARPLRMFNKEGILLGIQFVNKELPDPGIVYVDKIEKGIDYYEVRK